MELLHLPALILGSGELYKIITKGLETSSLFFFFLRYKMIFLELKTKQTKNIAAVLRSVFQIIVQSILLWQSLK